MLVAAGALALGAAIVIPSIATAGTGTISHVINGTGDAANSGDKVTYLVSGP